MSRLGEVHSSSVDGNSLLEPELVQKIVDELKSQGTFDQFRKDCMAEVDTKPGYQNLRQRVCHSLNKFLDRQQWKPTQNKNQLRNQLRKHIEDSGIMENGVRRIVDQVVNPKILSVIEPEVEYVMYNILGVEKPNNITDMSNGNNDDRASNVSSEDIEMRSIQGQSDEEDRKKKSPSSSPNLAGNISPLTPERKKDSPDLKGDISPLTPPLPPPREQLSPHTPPLPPLPPPMYLPPPPQLSDYPQQPSEMSPVSDTELSPETPSSESGLLSPLTATNRPDSIPTPPHPPPPGTEQGGGHSDISDTDLPSSSEDGGKSSELDIEDLEKAREAILAKMAEASLGKDDSEGEIHTEDDEAASDKKEASKVESDMSPISDDSQDDHESKKKRDNKADKTSSDEDDSKAFKRRDQASNGSSSKTAAAVSEESKTEESSKKATSSSASSKDDSSQHSKSSSSSKHRSSDHSKRSEKHHSHSSYSSSKDKHKEKSMKDLKKMEKIEKKVNRAITLKSNKFKDIDMFAPKAPKPKPPLHRPPSSASSSSGASPLPSFGSKSPLPSFGNKSPLPSFGLASKTPPSFGRSTSPKSNSCKSPSTHTHKPNSIKKTDFKGSGSTKQQIPSGHEKFTATALERTKVYPELPVSKPGSDKAKQHENDFADSKRRLEEARVRRIKEHRREDASKRDKRKHSESDDAEWRKEDFLGRRIRRSSSSNNSQSSRSRNNSVSTRGEDIESFNGFPLTPSSSKDSLESRSSSLKRIIQLEEESLERDKDNDSSIIVEEDEWISINGLSDPEGTAALLKKVHGGEPRVIYSPPGWLLSKLKGWGIPVEDVGGMSFTKPLSSDRRSKAKFISEQKFALKRKQQQKKVSDASRTKKAKRRDEVVSQLEREMNAIHSEKQPSKPFYGFDSSDLRPPSHEPKSSFLQRGNTSLWTSDMKRLFFDSDDDEPLSNLSPDLYDDYEEEFSTIHALNLIISPNYDSHYLEHDLPTSPSSMDSDEKGSSSPSSLKENVVEPTVRKKSRYSAKKNLSGSLMHGDHESFVGPFSTNINSLQKLNLLVPRLVLRKIRPRRYHC